MPMLSFLVWVSLAGCNFPYLSMLFIHSPPHGGTKDPQPTPSQSTFIVKHAKLKCMAVARSSSTQTAHSVIGKQQSLTQWAHSRNISKVSRNNSIDLLFHTRHLVSPPSPGNELSVSAYMWVGVYTGTISVIYPGISGCLHRVNVWDLSKEGWFQNRSICWKRVDFLLSLSLFLNIFYFLPLVLLFIFTWTNTSHRLLRSGRKNTKEWENKLQNFLKKKGK